MNINPDKISCIIIEDELTDRLLFQNTIEKHFKETLEIKGFADSVKEGVDLILKHNPEIVFLDIEMPLENGFQLFKYITKYTFEVIFTTGFKHYAIDAIKYAALDYLIKPVQNHDLSEALVRFQIKRNSNSSQERIETFISNLNYGTDINQKVAFPTRDGFELEKINDIIYCEGDANYTKVYLSNGKMLLVSRTLKEVEALFFSPYFFRIHKSYLVNLNYIKSYSRSANGIVLDNKVKLPVSVRKNDEFVSMLTKWRNRITTNLISET